VLNLSTSLCRPERKVEDTPKSSPAEARDAKGVLNFSTGWWSGKRGSEKPPYE
jgi:hypothetical protein